MLRIAIVGSRKFADEALVRHTVHSLPRDWTVVSGGAYGPDTWAVEEAESLGMGYVEYLADWSYGKGAGFARNTTIVENSDLVVAFWDGSSRGCIDTIQKAAQTNKIFYVVQTKEDVEKLISDLS